MILIPQKIKMLKIEDIKPNPYQVRRNFNAKSLRSLALSIKEVGLMCPIVVRATTAGYEVVSGERRVRAAQLAGLKSIPSIVVHAGDRDCALLSMTENLHRENPSIFEEAEGFYNLISYHRVKKEALLKKIALEKDRINEKLRLLSLSASTRYKIEENNIEESVAKELLKLHDEEKQSEIIEKIIEDALNRRQTADLVKNTLREMALRKNSERTRRRENADIPLYINTIKQTQQLLRNNGARVELNRRDTENAIEFTFRIAK